MTDAAISVTQSAVEAFTRQYLTIVGCTIETDGDNWIVTASTDAETKLVTGTVTLRCGLPETDSESELADGEPLHPESAFFQELLAEASEYTPVGALTLDAGRTDLIVPDWLAESDVTVTDTQFQPYYDRTALVVVFRIRVETVGEYQQELLRAVAVDSRTGENLSTLSETVLNYVDTGHQNIDLPINSELPDSGGTTNLIEAVRSTLMETVQPTINDIQQRASRAAHREIEDYRRMKQQREKELDKRGRQLQKRIENVSKQIDDAPQDERVRLLKQRRSHRDELDAIETERSNLQQRRRQGFPERQREIRDRHSLSVTVKPVTLTFVEYERGEVEFFFDDTGGSLTVGYGVGQGVTETINCETCGHELNGDRALGSARQELRCTSCIQQEQ